MKNKSLVFYSLSFFVIFITIFFNSCTKEGDSIENNIKKEPVLVPFFSVEKGELISKDVYRDKPEFSSDVTVIFSSEDDESGLKSSLDATSYITDLYILVSDKATAAAPWLYNKIDVDLNEGAGGKFIYLCYTKEEGKSPIRDMKLWAGGYYPDPEIESPWTVVENSNGLPYPGTDLNEGAGGAWIYLYENRSVSCGAPIKNIKVVSTSSASCSPDSGWTILNPSVMVDANQSAGGRFIYILYEK